MAQCDETECRQKVVEIHYEDISGVTGFPYPEVVGSDWEGTPEQVHKAWVQARADAEKPTPIKDHGCPTDDVQPCYCHEVRREVTLNWSSWTTPLIEVPGGKGSVQFKVQRRVGIAYGVCDHAKPPK